MSIDQDICDERESGVVMSCEANTTFSSNEEIIRLRSYREREDRGLYNWAPEQEQRYVKALFSA